MKSLAILILIFTAETIIAIFHPILFPQDMIDFIIDFFSSMWVWDGLLPVEACYRVLLWVISCMIAKFSWNVVMALISMASSANGPKME